MNCKKCGYTLGEGQIFCPNCKEYINSMQTINDNQINQNQQVENMSLQNQINTHQNDYATDMVYEEKKKGKRVLVIILIIIAAVFIGRILLLTIISGRNINSTIKQSSNQSFILNYNQIIREVRNNIIMETQITCKGNCYEFYDYNKENMNLIIEDKGDHYYVILEANKNTDYYDNVNLTEEDCRDFGNIKCKGKKISGKVYKQ